MNLIVNADKNWGIGKNNELLVHIPNDMKMFRQMTTGKVVVMGRKTLESFPVVVSRKNFISSGILTNSLLFLPMAQFLSTAAIKFIYLTSLFLLN